MSEKTEILYRVQDLTGWKINPARFKIITDTSDWMSINRGDALCLGDSCFAVRGNMHEPRFGIDDQPKMWVFNAYELSTGEEKIIKTVFHEEFYAHIGILKIRCYRSPEKEAVVLDTVRGDNRFMQGYTCYDEKKNCVRIIDYIRGKSFFNSIPAIPKPHEQYFHEDLPSILKKLKESFCAIRTLHESGLCHGDIRNDHIIIEAETGNYWWIDFDLKQDVSDFDIWSLGNILCYAVAKGLKTFGEVLKSTEFSDDVKKSLVRADSAAFYEYRIMNLKKLYPYIPDKLNDMLLHFTIQPKEYYRNFDEFCADFEGLL
jgi:hypothetical protein